MAASLTTLLVIVGTDHADGVGVPPYSARGLRQTLTPISQAVAFRRTVNAKLTNLAPSQFHKYKSTIHCDDQQAPTFDGLWPGAEIQVDCIAELAFKTIGGTPQRPMVDGSQRVDGDFTFYRPRIIFKVINFTNDTFEYEAKNSWQMELEEA